MNNTSLCECINNNKPDQTRSVYVAEEDWDCEEITKAEVKNGSGKNNPDDELDFTQPGVDWYCTTVGKEFLVYQAEQRKYPIDEEDLMEAVYLLFKKAEKMLVVEKAEEEALISIRYLFA